MENTVILIAHSLGSMVKFYGLNKKGLEIEDVV